MKINKSSMPVVKVYEQVLHCKIDSCVNINKGS